MRAGIWVALPLAACLLFACDKKSACEKGVTAKVTDGTHEHIAEVAQDHVARAVGGTYPVKGSANHEHVMTLRDADFEKLKSGESVTTRASSVQGHTHEITLSCP